MRGQNVLYGECVSKTYYKEGIARAKRIMGGVLRGQNVLCGVFLGYLRRLNVLWRGIARAKRIIIGNFRPSAQAKRIMEIIIKILCLRFLKNTHFYRKKYVKN